MFAIGLGCRQCGKQTELSAQYYCDDCFGPLEVRYDYTAIRRQVTPAQLAQHPSTLRHHLGPRLMPAL